MSQTAQIQFVTLIISRILDAHYFHSKASWRRNRKEEGLRAECNHIDFSLQMIHAAFSSYLMSIAYRMETPNTYLHHVKATRRNPIM